MSGSENSMQELFARAASLLLGNEVDAAGDRDAMRLLQALEYALESGNRIDPETANRAHLLIAASRFARVFELARPTRPACSALARNSIQHLPIPCMTEARWSAFPASE